MFSSIKICLIFSHFMDRTKDKIKSQNSFQHKANKSETLKVGIEKKKKITHLRTITCDNKKKVYCRLAGRDIYI